MLSFALALASATTARAAPENPKPSASGAAIIPPSLQGEIPEALKPWIGWVLHGQQEALCPFFQGDADRRECAWPARLSLTLDERGGRFTQQFRVHKRGLVPLPGNASRWPQDVHVDGKAAVVASGDGPDGDDDKAVPQVLLAKGDHTVTGSFLWDAMPESLAIPAATGLVTLSLRGSSVPLPSRDERGQLWLQKGESKGEEADLLEMTVHRMITDDLPLLLTTRIELRVSGKSREVLLARALPEGFIPMSLSSPIPARIEPDGRLRVQVRPGTHVMMLVARHDGKIDVLSRPRGQAGQPWAPGEEVWVFEARPDLRQVTIEGVPSIDPQQTTLPEAWKKLPAYPMRTDDTLHLVEQRRGDADPAPDQLALSRQLWLDFDGRGYSVSDRITGTLNRAWRLEIDPPTELGRVAVGGTDQFITRGRTDGGPARAGVEIRQGTVNLAADSRIPGALRELPAVSWNSDFHQVEGRLYLPPGWRLFAATGADDVPGTWVRAWTLLDLFLVLIVAMSVGRLYGFGFGVLALLALALTVPEPGAPNWSWLPVIAFEALLRVLPSGRAPRARDLFRLARAASLVALAVVLVPFAIHQIRHGLYPALEHADYQVAADRDVSQADNNEVPSWMKKAEAPSGAMQGIVGTGKGGGGAGSEEPIGAIGTLAKEDGDGEGSDKKLARKGGYGQKPQAGLAGLGSIGRGPGSGSYGSTANNYQQYANQYDPNSMVQTGPGLPRWDWNTVSLKWSGPVERGQRLKLWLIPPWGNLILGLLRVALLAFVFFLLAHLPERLLPFGRGKARAAGSKLAVLALLASGALPHSARADVPTKDLLDELQKRLLEHPECQPNCASSARLSLDVMPKTLRARMEIGAAASTAVKLPGSASQWSPQQVLLDGKSAPALYRDPDGSLWIAVTAGSHQVQLEGPLPSRDTVQIPLPLKPHRVEAKTQGWRLEGLHEDGLADDDLQLTRERKDTDEEDSLSSGALPPPLPPFVRIERELHLGLNWEADTRVLRVTPTGAAVVLEVPLLPGESVTTPDVRVLGGKALVNMAPGATEVSWHSVVQERPSVKLVASKELAWTEVWRLDVSPVWHVALSGLPVVHQHDAAGLRRPEWRPWPGEEATIEVTRPDGMKGQTLTLDHSCLDISPGLRATDVTLTLELRSSRGGQHVLTLPDGAILQTVEVNGTTQPIRQDKRHVVLPLVPGRQNVQLKWREPTGITTLFRTPTVDLGVASVNTEIIVRPGDGRWTLLADGPRLGPAVLFWSLLLVLLLVAMALGQASFTPLRTSDWILLGLGLSQVPVAAAALVAVWLLILGYRQMTVLRGDEMGWRLFNLRQLLIVGLTLVALGVLVASIREGLLGEPNMQIAGNGSCGSALRWFQDRTGAQLPGAWMLSVPMLVYRLAMLAWALWIARALLGWLRWGWKAWSDGGLWKKRPPKAAKEVVTVAVGTMVATGGASHPEPPPILKE